MIAVADTSFVIAAANQKDSMHVKCIEIYNRVALIYLPQSTLAEIGYMLGREGGNLKVAEFLFRLPKMKFALTPINEADIQRTAQLLQKYADTRLDFVDATVVAVAERLDLSRVLTLDQRDFRLVRPRHCDHFELQPTLD